MTSNPSVRQFKGAFCPRMVRVRIAAFSLIEVVLAVAIVSFSLLAIVGIMPIGLKSVRDSENDQAIGTIATQLRGQLQQVSFSPSNPTGITSLTSSNNYYSAEGLPIVSTTPTNVTPFYWATFVLGDAGVSDVADATFANTNARNVIVTLKYPAPAYTQSTSFSIMATSQTGL